MKFPIRNECVKCGTVNKPVEIKRDSHIPLPYILETLYYKCWYCGEIWAVAELREEKKCEH